MNVNISKPKIRKEPWMNNIFSRFERKFLLTTEQKNMVTDFLTKHLVYDFYSPNGKSYGIYNYYFDTVDHEVVRHSVSKPAYKDKVRMRYYDDFMSLDTQVFLEIKKKAFSRVNKRRIQLSLEKANAYLLEGKDPEMDAYIDKQIFNEIDYLIKTTHIKPCTYIEYHRIAFADLNSDLRITIDNHLIFSHVDDKLRDLTPKTKLIPDDLYLMEIKSGQNFPLWLVAFLSEKALFSQSFSKYGRAYQHYLQGGSIDDLILYKS